MLIRTVGVACKASPPKESSVVAGASGAVPSASAGSCKSLAATDPGTTWISIACTRSTNLLRALAVASCSCGRLPPSTGAYFLSTVATRGATSLASTSSRTSAISLDAIAIQRTRSAGSTGSMAGGVPAGLRMQRWIPAGKPQLLAIPMPRSS